MPIFSKPFGRLRCDLCMQVFFKRNLGLPCSEINMIMTTVSHIENEVCHSSCKTGNHPRFVIFNVEVFSKHYQIMLWMTMFNAFWLHYSRAFHRMLILCFCVDTNSTEMTWPQALLCDILQGCLRLHISLLLCLVLLQVQNNCVSGTTTMGDNWFEIWLLHAK